jgi:hypothetical protein
MGTLRLLFGVGSSGLLNYPTVMVGVICRLINCAMDLTGSIQNLFKLGQAIVIPLEGPFTRAQLGIAKSGVDSCFLGVATIVLVLALVFVAPQLTVPIAGLGGTGLVGLDVFSGKPTVLIRAKASNKRGQGCYRGFVTADFLVKGLSREAVALR